VATPPANRSPEQIRDSIERRRADLAHALENLRGEIQVASDWRRQLHQYQRQVLIGAAVAGFVLGGGLAGITGLFRRRR
jgi:hypothetical protein